ncbi:hypothetical protein CP532_1546 [Ophiocordyceps camponoti-leonardi (nom. inval.)]|nr:hypothetical protein CP532_1546 [Ophiocordyceps camponoti-leonardi (nom. inval.)]
MAATSVLGQSYDLLLCILDFLPFNDLLSMSLVNKHIHHTAKPHLYSAIETSWSLTSSTATPPTVLLLRSILERPELARYIRHLRLVGDGFEEDASIAEPPACPLDEASFKRASKLILDTGLPYAKFWLNELKSGTVDAMVTTLLMTTPRLESLFLGPNFTVRSRVLGKMLQSALSPTDPSESHQLPTFQNLRRVTFRPRYNQHLQLYVNNTTEVLPFLQLPKLQDLSLSIDNPNLFAGPLRVPPSSSLTSLEVSRFRETPLVSLLAPLKNLEKLHWNWSYQPDLDEGVSTNVIQLDAMTQAFDQVADTLTDLTVEAETRPSNMAGYYHQPPPLEIQGSLDDLIHLNQLKRLSIPWVFLMGFSDSSAKCSRLPLPPSLEVLTLTDHLSDNEQWEWHPETILSTIISELHRWTRPSSSNLKRIILPLPLSHDQVSHQTSHELQEIGESAGIELTWT